MFNRNSAFEQAAGIVPEGTPTTEEVRQSLEAAAPRRTHVSIPVTEYESWIEFVEDHARITEVKADKEDLEEMANEMRVYLP